LLGGNNDVNVVHKSPFVTKLLRSEEVGFMVNGTFHPCYYLLVDGIYPLGVLCKPYMNPKTISGNILPKCKKEHEKMLKSHSVFSKFNGNSSKSLPVVGHVHNVPQSLT
jgi:hypothetical protein